MQSQHKSDILAIAEIWISSYVFRQRGEAFPAVSISDEIAYRQCFNGDGVAADLLIKKYGDPLVSYINGYTKDIYGSEDLMIEVFSNMFVKKRSVDGPGSFKVYPYKITCGLALRHNQRHRIPFLHLDELSFEPQSEESVDTELLRNEQSLQLYHALRKLKREYREVLYPVYFESTNYRDAAIAMRKSEAQVTKLIYYGKQNLKTFLEQEDF